MTQPLTLYLPLQTFDDLQQAADGRGKKALVPKADLRALLMDHARVLAKLADLQIETEESYETCDAVRQSRKK